MKHSRTHFLLVEDDPNDTMLVQTVFRSAHTCGLSVVHDGELAIAYLTGAPPYNDRNQNPLPHVILLDLKMPRVSGFEFLHWLRAEAPQPFRCLPVIVMSSSDMPQDINRAYELGVNTYIVKPVNWRLFQHRLRALNIYWSHHAEIPIVS